MIVSIHQPQYLPWLPYLDKVDASDCFIYLDNVQYQKNGVLNRNQIKTSQGVQWLTVPVSKTGLHTKIFDAKINGNSYKTKHIKSIKQNYARARYFDIYMEQIERIINKKYSSLADLNIAFSEWLFEQFQITTRRIRASELDVKGYKQGLVLDICEKLEADVYISGRGAKDYQHKEKFYNNNVSIKYQNYNQPIYKQCWDKQGFIKGLSSLDLLMNVGPKKSRSILLCGRNYEE
jgi:hypothetical protein